MLPRPVPGRAIRGRMLFHPIPTRRMRWKKRREISVLLSWWQAWKDGRPSQKHASICKIREGRQGGKNEPTRNARKEATTVLPTTSEESCPKKGAEAIRRRVMDATAMLTFVPASGAQTRQKKREVAPPRPHAEDAEEEAASDVCVEILAGVVARWTGNLGKGAELQSKMLLFNEGALFQGPLERSTLQLQKPT